MPARLRRVRRAARLCPVHPVLPGAGPVPAVHLPAGFGGTGDYDADLETLAGETRPAGPGDNAPSGAQIGTNGVFGRENSSGGRSIDIPANGDKPHETLHYPREEK